jgi:hypothetical protein
MATTIDNIFTGLATPKDITAYTLARGVQDFSNLAQFNYYEQGYSYFVVLSIPKFLQSLCDVNTDYKSLILNYRHLLEYDFKGLDGLENITVDTQEINNGISSLNVITKVMMQGGSEFSIRVNERKGSVIEKTHELYLTGIKDPRSQAKTYHGLIQNGTLTAGYENEVFNFLYFTTDNTYQNIESAYLIVGAQIQSAETQMYSFDRGDIGTFREISIPFSGYPIKGPAITAKAQNFLTYINNNTVYDSYKFAYNAYTNMPTPGDTGGTDASSAEISM